MSIQKPNIVQVEFFRVSFSSSLEDLQTECVARMGESSEIKSEFRILDKDGSLTQLVVSLQEIEKRRHKIRSKIFTSAGFWEIKIMSCFYRWLGWKLEKLESSKKELVLKGLRASSVAMFEIAIERPDRTYRAARKNELHELLEAFKKTTRVWLWIFKSNELLGDKNVIIAASTLHL